MSAVPAADAADVDVDEVARRVVTDAADSEIQRGVAEVGELDAQALFFLRARGIPEGEARALLVEAFLGEALDAIDTPFTCPHGRPLSYTLKYEQIFRFFKR
jgi:hypothetical protein